LLPWCQDIKPHVPAGLAGAALQLETTAGLYEVQWSQGNATASSTTLFALDVTIPVGAHARVCIPTYGKQLHTIEIHENGKEAWSAGRQSVSVPGCGSGEPIGAPAGWMPACIPPECLDSICFACGSGAYEFKLIA
jgi:hypothetical protein